MTENQTLLIILKKLLIPFIAVMCLPIIQFTHVNFHKHEYTFFNHTLRIVVILTLICNY